MKEKTNVYVREERRFEYCVLFALPLNIKFDEFLKSQKIPKGRFDKSRLLKYSS